MTRRFCTFAFALVTIVTSLVAYTWAQAPAGGFAQFWGPNYTAPAVGVAAPTVGVAARLSSPRPDPGAVDSMHHWNHVAIDSSGLDHTPVPEGDPRVFGEQLGPGRASRAMAIVHIAMFDAVNAIAKRYRSFTGIADAAPGASMEAAIAQAAHDTLVAMYPSQKDHCDALLTEELAKIADGRGKTEGIRVGQRAARAILRPPGQRWLDAGRTDPRHRVHHQRPAGQMAAGSHQPDPDCSRRQVGRRQTVRRARRQGFQGPATAGADQPCIRGGVQRGQTPRRRRRDHADHTH